MHDVSSKESSLIMIASRWKLAAALAAIGSVAAPAAAGAQAPALARFAYQSTTQTPSGPQSVSCTITIAPAAGGATSVTITIPGKPPMTIALPAGGGAPAMPAPQGSPNPARAQAQLILERVAMLSQLKAAKAKGGPLTVQVPVLPPGASQPLRLPATLVPKQTAAGATLSGDATIATSATIDPQKAKVHGIMPVRRVAQRLKNAVTPATVTVPDTVMASVKATIAGMAFAGLSGGVTNTLSGNGKSVDITEKWTLTKT
jgi:hypothetical protein